jgi:TonB family protein
VGESKLSSVIGRIPLVRRLKKQRQAFVPPRPSHEYHPVLTASERRSLVRPVAMDVRVFVAENGKVSYAELLSNSGQHRDLATAAVYAARRWDFVPARIGNERVPGEVILHFRFWPDRPSDATQ